MKVNRYKVKFGKIVAYMYLPESKKALPSIIFAYGMPGSPQQGRGAIANKFSRRGFIAICPHYLGTFDSEGICTMENTVDTLLETIRFLKKGRIKLPWAEKPITWKVKDISLLGGSFGSSVVLVAGAKSKDIKKIIAVATPTDYRDQGKRFKDEEGMEIDYKIIKYCWRTWHPVDKYWKKLIKGYLDLNAVDYISKLKTKDVLLIHGELDKDVYPRRSIELYEKIKSGSGKSKLILLPRTRHVGNTLFERKDMFEEAVRWLK